MEFSVRGEAFGDRQGVELTWRDGEVFGAPVAVAALRAAAEPPGTASPSGRY